MAGLAVRAWDENRLVLVRIMPRWRRARRLRSRSASAVDGRCEMRLYVQLFAYSSYLSNAVFGIYVRVHIRNLAGREFGRE